MCYSNIRRGKNVKNGVHAPDTDDDNDGYDDDDNYTECFAQDMLSSVFSYLDKFNLLTELS